MAAEMPGQPWVPASCRVRVPVRGTTTTRLRGGEQGRERPCWDVRFTVDGRRFFRRFDRAGDAEAYVAQLRRGESMSWPFDPAARRFIDPALVTRATSQLVDDETGDHSPSVLSWTEHYWARKWPTLEPKGRAQLARYLNRARRWLVDTEPSGANAAAVDSYLVESLSVTDDPGAASDGRAWLEAHSLSMAAVGRAELEALVERFTRNHRDPSKRVAASSIKRMVADLRPCWDRAVLEGVVSTNPWRLVDLGLRSLAGGKRASSAPVLAADADIVLDPGQVWALADACAERGSWGPIVRGFILVMGFCGLRPNEAAGLIIGDLEIDGDRSGWLTVRRNHRRVAERYLDVEEDPTWGPLKGRELTEQRRVPVPAAVAAALRVHRDEHRAGASEKALVFERHGRPFDLSNFHGDVWVPGRAALFPLDRDLPDGSPHQPKLARLRRHDLRHSACSMWLRAGVDVTVCQKWSGHKRLSVFLDVYQGVMPGREYDGVRSLEALLSIPEVGRLDGVDDRRRQV